MLSRRIFSACGIGAAIGLVASGVDAQTPAATSGVTRTVLGKAEVPGSRYDTIQVSAVVAAGTLVGRHTHPGTESAFVLDGEGVLMVQGKPDQPVKPGDSYFVPQDVPHALQCGGRPMKIAATYVVDRDKPLASPAPA